MIGFLPQALGLVMVRTGTRLPATLLHNTDCFTISRRRRPCRQDQILRLQRERIPTRVERDENAARDWNVVEREWGALGIQLLTKRFWTRVE
jgi:hypothetical protein